MDVLGLVSRYSSNRPLQETDFTLQLKQKKRLNIKPCNQLSVITMNSTYLESVDKWFAWKGIISCFSVTVLVVFSITFAKTLRLTTLRALGILPSPEDVSVLATVAITLAMGWGIVSCVTIWLLKKESFAYTHFPIRFNRKTRTVHVFRTDGTVLSVPWDDVFFTLGRTGGAMGSPRLCFG